MVPAGTMRGRAGAALAAVLAVLALAACRQEPAPQPAASRPVDPAFVAATEEWRRQRLDALLQPDGWTSLVGLHWLELKAHYVGSGERIGNAVRFAFGPPRMGMVERDPKGRYWFVPERGVELTFNGEPLRGRVRLPSDQDAEPGVIGFDGGKGRVTLLRRGDRHALRVRHADAHTRVNFAGLSYWPADPSWRIVGRFVPHPPGKTLPIGDIVGTQTDSPNPGVVEFERDGRGYRLETLGAPGGKLFIVMADRTSGHGSYPAGRFLDADAPDAHGRVVLDFNRAYNPPCAFTLFATCPLPPPQNRIDLAVTAGEKNYVAPGH